MSPACAPPLPNIASHTVAFWEPIEGLAIRERNMPVQRISPEYRRRYRISRDGIVCDDTVNRLRLESTMSLTDMKCRTAKR